MLYQGPAPSIRLGYRFLFGANALAYFEVACNAVEFFMTSSYDGAKSQF